MAVLCHSLRLAQVAYPMPKQQQKLHQCMHTVIIEVLCA
jgi:hypothetical protein